jgi:hypothetical protein
MSASDGSTPLRFIPTIKRLVTSTPRFADSPDNRVVTPPLRMSHSHRKNSTMPIAAPAKPSRALLRLGILGGWILFLLMVLAITWAGALLRGQRFNFASTLVWNLGWLLWAAATFLVAWLARRFPLERAHLARGIAVHVAFGIAIGVAILGLEFLLQHALEALVPGAPRANAFLGFIVYKFHVYFLIYWMIVGSTRAYEY